MEIARLGLQAAYGPTTSPAASVNTVGGIGERESGAAQANETGANQPPASTRVTLSAAGQSRLAAEQQGGNEAVEVAQQSAAVAQNTPVVSAREATDVRNEPAERATPVAPAPEPARSGNTDAALPLQQASVTSATGGATPAPAADAASRNEAAARADASASQAREANAPAAPRTPSSTPAPAPTRQQVEQAAQQNRERQDTAAQARQDVSPVLAHSGVTTYREVLSM